MDGAQELKQIEGKVEKARREGRRPDFVEIGLDRYEHLPGDVPEYLGGKVPYENRPPKDVFSVPYRFVDGDVGTTSWLARSSEHLRRVSLR